MSDLIPGLDDLPAVAEKPKKKRGRPNRVAMKGKTYTMYITPAEHQLLMYLSAQHGNGNVSDGVRYLIRFFSEHVQGNR